MNDRPHARLAVHRGGTFVTIEGPRFSTKAESKVFQQHGFAIIGMLSLLVPALPVSPSWPYMLAAVMVAVLIGLVAGVLPAWRAAQLDPVESLRAE